MVVEIDGGPARVVYGRVVPPPWQEPIVAWDAVFDPWLWAGLAAVAAAVAMVRCVPTRRRAMAAAVVLPCLLYATLPLYGSPTPSWVLPFSRHAVTAHTVEMILMSAALGGAVLVTCCLWRSSDALVAWTARAVVLCVAPMATGWALCVALAGVHLGQLTGPTGVWFLAGNALSVGVAVWWWRRSWWAGSEGLDERAAAWRSAVTDTRDWPLFSLQWLLWSLAGLMAVGFIGVWVLAVGFIESGVAWRVGWAGLLGTVLRAGWLTFGLAAVVQTAARLLRDERRFRPGQCHVCGYDMRGLLGGDGTRCPECGAAYVGEGSASR